MSTGTLIRTAALAVSLVGVVGCFDLAAAADRRVEAGPPRLQPAPLAAGIQFVPLGIGKAVVVDLPDNVKDVLVADPSIANAVIRSSRRAYLIGAKVGQTNILFFDAEGRQIAGYDIAVTRDLNTIRAAIKRVLPHADITVEGLGQDNLVLSGTVATPAESQMAYDIAVRLVGTAPGIISTSNTATADGASSTVGQTSRSAGDSHVVNALTIRERDQVMLKVTVAEVQRDIVKQLGIDLSASLGSGNAVLDFATVNPFTALGQALTNTAVTGAAGGFVIDPFTGGTVPRVSAVLRAMERAGVIRTLAEPNLTAISGENATFLAGGEFPIPGGLTCDSTGHNCQVAVQFKKFGIGLTFTPVVLSEGRISLKVMTEVSDLSNESSIALQPTINGPTVTIPSIRTRRAETTVEIPSGGALAMAGMIQEQTKQQINGLPGLMQLPILGALFKSRDYVNRQTELMVLVTPYIVRSVAPKDLSRPDDGFADASDPASVLMGRLNRIYGIAGSVDPPRTYYGKYGFIID